MSASTDPFPPPSRYVLPVILLAVFVLPMGLSGTAIALPHIAKDLGSSPALLQWVVNGFNVSFAAFTLVWGVLSDRLGYRSTFTLGTALSLLASLFSVVAPGLVELDVARVLAGTGAAAVFTGATAILSTTYPPETRGRVFAIMGTVIGLGLALGPTVAGGLISWVGWRGVFSVFVVMLGLVLAGSRMMPAVRHQHDPDRKLIDFSLLRNASFLLFCMVPVACAIGYITLLTYLPVALSGISGLSAGASGLVMLPMTLPVLVGPILAARLIANFARISAMTMIYASLACLMLGDLGMLLLSPGSSVVWIMAPMLLAGFGFGLPLGLVDGEALAAVPERSSGTAAGVLNFLRLGSEALAVALYAAVLTWLVGRSISNHHTAQVTAAGQPGHAAAYSSAFHVIVIGMIVLVGLTAAAIAVLHHAQSSRRLVAGGT